MRANIFNFFIVLILVFDMGGDLGIRSLAVVLMLISMVDVFFTNSKITLSDNILYEVHFTVQDNEAFDLCEEEKEIKIFRSCS